MDATPYRFAARALVWALPILLPLAAFERGLWRAGEATPIGRVHEAMTARPGALFGRQFLDQGLYRFKWIAIRRQDPAIIALGNSRVMQFRRGMFGARAADFVNAGGMVQHVRDLEQVVEELPVKGRLACAIIGADFAWFNDRAAAAAEAASGFAKAVRADDGLDGTAHAHLFQQVLRNGFSSDPSRPTWSVLAGAWRGGEAAEVNAWGFLARNRRTGFRADGSYDYALPESADTAFTDRERPTVLERIQTGTRGFQPAPSLSEDRIVRFLACVRTLRGRGVTVLCFTPPYPSTAVAALESDPALRAAWRQYRENLPTRIREAGAVFVDASSPAVLGLDDRCMRDGLHAMETFHVRLLAAFAADPGAATAGLDAAYLRRVLDSPRTGAWFPDYGDVR